MPLALGTRLTYWQALPSLGGRCPDCVVTWPPQQSTKNWSGYAAAQRGGWVGTSTRGEKASGTLMPRRLMARLPVLVTDTKRRTSTGACPAGRLGTCW